MRRIINETDFEGLSVGTDVSLPGEDWAVDVQTPWKFVGFSGEPVDRPVCVGIREGTGKEIIIDLITEGDVYGQHTSSALSKPDGIKILEAYERREN